MICMSCEENERNTKHPDILLCQNCLDDACLVCECSQCGEEDYSCDCYENEGEEIVCMSCASNFNFDNWNDVSYGREAWKDYDDLVKSHNMQTTVTDLSNTLSTALGV